MESVCIGLAAELGFEKSMGAHTLAGVIVSIHKFYIAAGVLGVNPNSQQFLFHIVWQFTLQHAVQSWNARPVQFSQAFD